MCGRYYRRSDKQRIAEAYRLGEIPFDLVLPDWDFNIAPTTFQPVIRGEKETGMAAAPCNPKVGNVKNNGLEMLNSA